MDEHAERYYEEIRHRTTDVVTIAQNTGMTVADIEAIKRHVFINEYDLGEDMVRRFDPSYDMAVSWQRLIDGKDIQKMDITLLRHEILQYKYMINGMTYDGAHATANELYNYESYTTELDRKAGLK